MIETVVSVGYPVDETLHIKKNRLIPEAGLSGGEKRISIVTGTHGDELEGQYVCYELQRRVREHPDCLKGIVDVYPALNPLGIDSITRGIPAFDLDMNRIFPGAENGSMPEYIAARIVDDLSGSDMVIDIHASNIFLKEIPQVRINTLSRDVLVPYAKKLNIDFIWVHAAATVLESTLAYSLNSIGTPTLVVEMGGRCHHPEGAHHFRGRRGVLHQRRGFRRVRSGGGALEGRKAGRTHRRYSQSPHRRDRRTDSLSRRWYRVYPAGIPHRVRRLADRENSGVRRRKS